MKQTELKNLAKLVKKTSQYQPDSRPKKPETQPSVKQLNEVYTLDLKKMVVDIG